MRNLRSSLYILLLLACASCNGPTASSEKERAQPAGKAAENARATTAKADRPVVDEVRYDRLLRYVANGDTTGLWPVKEQPLPLEGALLPYNRIVAYYGNLYSRKMGILGEYPPDAMWNRLDQEVEAWQEADPDTPALAAIHYIAVVAQGSPMRDGKWRMRMPAHQIDSAMAIARMHDALVFLDLQVGMSTVEEELPLLEKYLRLPHVHLGVDPEFSMKDSTPPGKKIGTCDAADINFCTEYLSGLVRTHNLPPKVLVVHRFTKGMLTNYRNIRLHPEVQVVIDMDGFGRPELKYHTYDSFVRKKPVQFTGFKLFYKNDVKPPPHRMITPGELMKLSPRPLYIQYQ